jgi:hypothetical protein
MTEVRSLSRLRAGIVPSTLTAMRCDDLSIWTTTSARAGADPAFAGS